MYSLIIVDYNSINATTEYIKSCKDALGVEGGSHVVIVQNGQDVLEQLKARYGEPMLCSLPKIAQLVYRFHKGQQDICYCCSGENMGYAKGNNLGVRIAQAVWNDPHYIISNNDLVFEKPIDLSVVNALFDRDPTVGIIGPGVFSPSGISQSPNRWRGAFSRLIGFYWVRTLAMFLKGERKSRLLGGYSDTVASASEGPCGWVSGCFFFVRAEAFHRAGMFDENTFLYAEELILSRRMEKAGYKVWFCPKVSVVHNHAQTTKKAISLMQSREIEFRAVWYYYKTYTNTSALLLALAKWNFALYKFLFLATRKIKEK